MSDLNETVSYLSYDGEVSIRTITDAYARILTEINRTDVTGIRLDVSAVTETDLTFVQLLLSARRTAVAAGKSFVLSAAVSEPLQEVLERGGFLNAPDDSAQFWRPAGDNT